MNRLHFFTMSAGLATALLASSAYAGCGLDVDPAALDTDHNGTLSLAETRGTPLAGVFSRVDQNGNGAISPPEFGGRCASATSAWSNVSQESPWEDTVVDNKVERQTQRQRSQIDERVDRETDKAADSLVDKALGALFGN